MNIHDTLFWFFSIAMLLCGVLVIANRNPVASALALVTLFVFLAGLFVLLEAFFLAAIQILVYAGAVMVLFLFVIMLLDIKASERRQFQWFGVIGGLIVAGLFVWELGAILARPIDLPGDSRPVLRAGLKEVVIPLFRDHMLPFITTALLLLVAMVGVILLSKREIK